MMHCKQPLSCTADPIFFLHHTQLDRLWWIWQQRDPTNRMYQYRGKASYYSNATASLDDIIPMGGLAPNVSVSEIMDTRSGILYYAY